jgi:hypothetical protein
MPTQLLTPAFGVAEQLSVGTVQAPLTLVNNVVDDTT